MSTVPELTDAEIEAMLNEISGGAPVEKPTATIAPAPTVTNEEADIAAAIASLDEELEQVAAPAAEVKETLAPAKDVEGSIPLPSATIPVTLKDEIDPELAALEAEMKDLPELETPPKPANKGAMSKELQEKLKAASEGAPSVPPPSAPLAEGPTKPAPSGVVHYVDPAKLKQDVSINPLKLEESLMNHASMFVHYAVQSSLARAQYEKMKAAFEILESSLDNKHRTALKEDNPKTTEAQIRAAVVTDAAWKSANVRVIEARTVYDLAMDAKEAFAMRRDALLQIAKDKREEALGQIRLKEADIAQQGLLNRMKEARQ